MTKFFLSLLLMFPMAAWAQFDSFSFYDTPTFRIQGSPVGQALINPTDLDNRRKTLVWNNFAATDGTFDKMPQSDLGIGIALGPGHLMVHYFQGTQGLKTTDISATSTLQDSFLYKAKYLFYDVPWIIDYEWLVSFGVGIGKAEKFDFRQKFSSGEEVAWSASPTGYRVRGSIGYLYAETIGVYLEAGYEMMKSTLTASADYPSVTMNGEGIEGGDVYKDRNGKDVEVDISGGRFGLGLILMF